MQKTKIPWVKNPDGTQGYTWNPISGCLNGCPYCYARRLANTRLKHLYLANKNLAEGAKGGIITLTVGSERAIEREGDYADPFYPRFWPERLEQPFGAKGSVGIFTCDMGELFGDWVPKEWQEAVFNVIKIADRHRFYLLTKQPQNLIKFSPFPENCWVGVTATNQAQYTLAYHHLADVEAKVKYLSFEPLLKNIKVSAIGLERRVNWVIIGACTGRKNEIMELCQRYPELTPMPYGKIWTAQPKIEWIVEIVEACDKAGIPVFLKDNLIPLLRSVDYVLPTNIAMGAWLRQEMPR